MYDTTSFNICVDSDILKQYGKLGVDFNTAINVFLYDSLCEGDFLFDVRLENLYQKQCLVLKDFGL